MAHSGVMEYALDFMVMMLATAALWLPQKEAKLSVMLKKPG